MHEELIKQLISGVVVVLTVYWFMAGLVRDTEPDESKKPKVFWFF